MIVLVVLIWRIYLGVGDGMLKSEIFEKFEELCLKGFNEDLLGNENIDFWWDELKKLLMDK